MATSFKLNVNGRGRSVKATPDTPLLYVLRNQLGLTGPLFGCGLAQCGACSVLVGDKEIRSCVTPVAGVVGKEIHTLEGLPAYWAKQKGVTQTEALLHPVQQAWIDEQVPQCGYCQGGMMVTAAALLKKVKRPTDAQIRSAMNGHLCRCGTHFRILSAIKRAAKATA
jgi:aerobic-type carbon monoxide dehydrogenase small subunit (CoxS/CutS family)